MMNAPIGPVDDGIGLASKLVMQPALDEPANHSLAVRILMQSQRYPSQGLRDNGSALANCTGTAINNAEGPSCRPTKLPANAS